ncbi:MAG: hypothetical protein Q8M94_09045 [Ignavibacteria bacterium]|nr:hypothetical protein [Ignavibacteria bacterium]
MYTMEGTKEIPLEDFWKFVMQYSPGEGDEIIFGVPRVNKENDTIEIDFAASSESSPDDWKEKPKALKQWDKVDG